MDKIGYVLIIIGIILIIVGYFKPSLTQSQLMAGDFNGYIVGGVISIFAGVAAVFVEKTT